MRSYRSAIGKPRKWIVVAPRVLPYVPRLATFSEQKLSVAQPGTARKFIRRSVLARRIEIKIICSPFLENIYLSEFAHDGILRRARSFYFFEVY